MITTHDKKCVSATHLFTRDGGAIVGDRDCWSVTGASMKHNFPFNSLYNLASPTVVESLRVITLFLLENRSMSHAHSQFSMFAAMLRSVGVESPVNELGPIHFLTYRSTLGENTEWHLGALRGLFRLWRDLRLPGLDSELVCLADQMRLKGNRKGDAVRSSDPKKGPFTDLELEAIVAAVNDAVAVGDIDDEDYVLVWLFLALGARSVQLATLKLSDFSVVCASDGTTAYLLRVPRAKQRGEAPRSQFKTRPLLPDIGSVVMAHCKVTRARWGELGLGPDEDAPFFINKFNENAIPVLRYHCKSDDLARRIQKIFNVIRVVSERTGEEISITARRFRYTVGTRAAREGASELVIAELLDHNDTQYVGVYVEAVPDIVERIDKRMAMHLARMAQAFAGVLIDGEDAAIRGDDPRSRIVRPEDFLHPVGNCGHHGVCGAMAPVACYTCRNFEPWVDGPHEEVLEQLLAERDRIMQETGDARIAAVNDRLIAACAEVVRLCEARRIGEAPCTTSPPSFPRPGQRQRRT